MQNLDKILEGLLFLAGEGVDKGIIMEKLQVTPKQLDNAIEVLKKRYDKDSGITFITYKDKLQLCGNQKFADDVSVVLNPIRERQLTKSTLEVMAIIAYKQPVTRLDVQDIRGINSDYAIQTLLNYKLIEVVGRKDAVGKPLLFGTTDEFLRHFGINQIEELPNYDELMKNLQELQIQNNHLYNEFEIPDEDEQNEGDETSKDINSELTNEKDLSEVENTDFVKTEEIKNDEKPAEIKEKNIQEEIVKEIPELNDEIEEKPANSEKKSKTKNKLPKKVKSSEIVENLEEKQIDSKEENEEILLNEEEQIKQTSDIFEDLLKNKDDVQEEDDDKIDGIDWSILFDNPDIEQ